MDGLIPVIALLIGLGVGLAVGTRSARRSAEAQTRALEIELDLLRTRTQTSDAERTEEVRVASLIEGLEKRVKEFQDQAARADQERIKADSAIGEQIKAMRESNANLVTETTKLAGTLSNASNRGRFGEMQLEQLLSHSGLQKDVHYRKQTKVDDGRIPDVVVNLPGGGEIFIDSKFPFERFWDAATASTPEQEKEHRAAHARDLLAHAEALAKRGYHHRDSSPDFVVLFAPFESILSVALAGDPQLLDKMFAKQVVIATPTTMLALLRTIGYGYSQYDSAANAAKIRDLAVLFLKRSVTVHSKLETLGKRLRSTATAYSDLVATADNSIFVPARKMRDLGISASASLAPIDGDVHVREFEARAIAELGDGLSEEDLDDALIGAEEQ